MARSENKSSHDPLRQMDGLIRRETRLIDSDAKATHLECSGKCWQVFIAAAFGTCCLFFSTGCEVAGDLLNSPHAYVADKNGLTPVDVVSNFVKAAIATNLVEAGKYWYSDIEASKLLNGRSNEENLSGYCWKFQRLLKTYTISRTCRGKGLWVITLNGESPEGVAWSNQFGVAWIGGEWKIERGYHW